MSIRNIGLVCSVVCVACSGAPGAGSPEDGLGEARAAVLLAPTDAKCIVITVTGTSTVSQQFNVAPEGSTVFNLSGLPLGTDTFTANGYGVVCSAVTGTTAATYTSAPTTATVAVGTPVNVTFQMAPATTAGSASVGVNFTPSTHGTITEFSIPQNAGAITAGADGNLWAIEPSKMVRVTSAGTYTEFPFPGTPTSTSELTAGPDGNIWVTETSGSPTLARVARVTPTGTITEYGLGSSGSLGAITAGADGYLYFGELSANKIGRLSTAGALTEFAIPTAASSVWGMAAGADGNIWFIENAANKIARMTLANAFTEFPITTAASGAEYVTAGADGNLWFTEFNTNKIGKATTAGAITEYTIPTAASGPTAITAGPDGAVWFVEQSAYKVGRVTTAGVFTEFLIPTTQIVFDINAGPDGNIWVTYNAKVARLVL